MGGDRSPPFLMAGIAWTIDEIDFLQATNGAFTVAELTYGLNRKFGSERTQQAVYDKLCSLTLSRRTGVCWFPAEERFLGRHQGEISQAELALRMTEIYGIARSEAAVKNRLHRGLPKEAVGCR